LSPGPPRAATNTGVARLGGNSFASASSTTRAEWSRGSTPASTPVNLMLRTDPERDQQRRRAGRHGTGRRMIMCERRYQKPPRSPEASRWMAACQRRGLSAFTRGPSAARMAGSSVAHERGHQRADEPADAHRVEEAQREDEQRGERRRDGHRREQHGPPGGGHRRAQGRAVSSPRSSSSRKRETTNSE
jgi:hypothetical protein